MALVLGIQELSCVCQMYLSDSLSYVVLKKKKKKKKSIVMEAGRPFRMSLRKIHVNKKGARRNIYRGNGKGQILRRTNESKGMGNGHLRPGEGAWR